MKNKVVVSKVDSPFEYDEFGSIRRYGLSKNSIYRMADVVEISPGPNNDDFIHIIQIDGKVIPHLSTDFYSIDEWRSKQIKKILNG